MAAITAETTMVLQCEVDLLLGCFQASPETVPACGDFI
jgi:hypothetical protein